MGQLAAPPAAGGHLLGYRLRGPVDPGDDRRNRWRAEPVDLPGRLVHVTWLPLPADHPERAALLDRLRRRQAPVPDGVLPVVAVETDPDGVLVVTPPTAGGSLRTRADVDAWPREQVQELTHRLREQLRAAHGAGVEGLDVRAETVRFTAEGAPCFTGVTVRAADATVQHDQARLDQLLAELAAAVTEPAGPEPASPGQTAGPRSHSGRGRRVLVALAISLPLAVAPVGGPVEPPPVTATRPDPAQVPTAPTPPTQERNERMGGCPDRPTLPWPADGSWVLVDLHGDGCPRLVTWDGSLLVVHDDVPQRTLRFELIGAAGDRLVTVPADDGRRRQLAVHRPTTGVTYVFEQLATPDAEVTASVVPPDPAARPG